MFRKEGNFKKSKSCQDMAPQQIYNIVMGKDKGGIQGYICPKKYFDYCVIFG